MKWRQPLECGSSRYCWRTPSAPEARGTLAGVGAKRNHRIRHNRATRPERAPDPGCFCREFWSVAPPGREKSLLVCPGGCAALRHRLISVAPPGREIASLSSPAVSLDTALVVIFGFYGLPGQETRRDSFPTIAAALKWTTKAVPSDTAGKLSYAGAAFG